MYDIPPGHEIDPSILEHLESSTPRILENNLEEVKGKVEELRSISERLRASLNDFREKILISEEPTVMRTSAYSGFHPNLYGTDPLQYTDSSDPICTKNAPYNAIKHIDSMQGNFVNIKRIYLQNPYISIYVYDAGSVPNTRFCDECFTLMNKTFVIYNAKTEMSPEALT